MGKPVDPTYENNGWRARTNVPDPTGVDAVFDGSDTAEDTDWTQTVDELIRIRMVVEQTDAAATAGGDMVTEFLLQYNNGGAGWLAVGAVGADVEDVQFIAATGFADGDNTATSRLTSSMNNYIAGDSMEVAGASDTLPAFTTEDTSYTEMEVSVEIVGSQVTDADTIDLRFIYSFQNETPPNTAMVDTSLLTMTVDKPAGVSSIDGTAAVVVAAPTSFLVALMDGTVATVVAGTGTLVTPLTAGTAAVVADGSGTLVTPLEPGTAAVIVAATGDLSAFVDIDGTAVVVADATGTLVTLLEPGTAAVIVDGTGSLSSLVSIDGTAAVVVDGSGTLVTPLASGSADVIVAGTGTLSSFFDLDGSADVIVAATGTLTALMDGTSAVVAAGTGTLVTPLTAGTAAVVVDGSGTLVTVFDGISVVVADATGTLVALMDGTSVVIVNATGTIVDLAGDFDPIDGTAAVIADASGTLTALVDGTSAVVAAASGTLVALLDGTAAVVVDGAGTLAALMSGTSVVVVDAPSSLSAFFDIDGTAVVVVSGTGTLTDLAAPTGALVGTAAVIAEVWATEVSTGASGNPVCIPVSVIFVKDVTGRGIPDYTVFDSEGQFGDFSGENAYYLYRNEAPGRVPIYRLTSDAGTEFVYSLQPRKGHRHQLDQLLGYASTTQKDGMVELEIPRRRLNLPGDSRYQSDFQNFLAGITYYAYPNRGSFNPNVPETRFKSASQSQPDGDLVYESSNYKHTVEVNYKGPHINRWTIENTAIGLLPIQFINIGGPPTGDFTSGDGLGRGLQQAVGFQDYEGFEGSDDVRLYPQDPDGNCLTVHNPTQAGSDGSSKTGTDPDYSGRMPTGSIQISFAQGVDFVDVLVAPMDFVEVPPFNVNTPLPTGRLHFATEWHGQQIFGSDRIGGGLWETLRMRQRLDLDWQGREGVHKMTCEFFTPVDIVSLPFLPTLGGIINVSTGQTMNNAFSNAYVYDPVHHTAPIDMSAFTFSTSSAGNATCSPPKAPTAGISGFEDQYGYEIRRTTLIGSSTFRPPFPCDVCTDSVTEIFATPSIAPTFFSRKASMFMKTDLPAAAPSGEKFGIGMVVSLSPRGPYTSVDFKGGNSGSCFPSEDGVIDEYSNTFSSMGGRISIPGLAGQSVRLPAGTLDLSFYYITDTLDKFQGHVDWLDSIGAFADNLHSTSSVSASASGTLVDV